MPDTLDGRTKAYNRFKEAYPEAEYTQQEFDGYLDDPNLQTKIYKKLSDKFNMPAQEEFISSIQRTQQKPDAMKALKQAETKYQSQPKREYQERVSTIINDSAKAVSTAVNNEQMAELDRRNKQMQLARATEQYNEIERIGKETEGPRTDIATRSALIQTNEKLTNYLDALTAHNAQPTDESLKAIQALGRDKEVIKGIEDIKAMRQIMRDNKDALQYFEKTVKEYKGQPDEIRQASVYNGPEGKKRLEKIQADIDKSLQPKTQGKQYQHPKDFTETRARAKEIGERQKLKLAQRTIDDALLAGEEFGRTKAIINNVEQLIPYFGEIESTIDNALLMEAQNKPESERTEAEKAVVEANSAIAGKQKALDITDSKAMTFGRFMDASFSGAAYSAPYMIEIAMGQGVASPIAKAVYKFGRKHFMPRMISRLAGASIGQASASMMNLPAIAKQASDLALENPDLAADTPRLLLSATLHNAAGWVTEVGGKPIDKILDKLGNNFYRATIGRVAARTGSKSAFVNAVAAFRKSGNFDGFLGENWENELDEIVQQAIGATIDDKEFDYKLPFTDDDATNRLIEGAGAIAIQQLGFGLPSAPGHVRNAIKDTKINQEQPVPIPPGEKPKISAPENLKPKTPTPHPEAAAPKEGETAHNLTSPSDIKQQRVIAPNGEEATLIGESKTTASIKYDDGSVEQYPIDEIEAIPESKSEILGSQEPAVASETQDSGEAALAEQETPEKKLSSTQVNIPEAEVKPFVDFAKTIPEDELYKPKAEENPSGHNAYNGYGIETEPHVTALFGLKTMNPEEIAKTVKDFGDVELKLGKMSLFKNDKYDVLKVDVESKDLVSLNKKLRENHEYESDHPDYKPHLTVAYLKPGEGEKYVGNNQFEGKTVKLKELVFSDAEGKHTSLPLTEKRGEPNAAPISRPQTQDVGEVKEPWQMTSDEYVEKYGKEQPGMIGGGKYQGARMVRLSEDKVISTSEHGKLVYEALQAGKPVPEEVLKEYPELQGKAEPPQAKEADKYSNVRDIINKYAEKDPERYPARMGERLFDDIKTAIDNKNYEPLRDMVHPMNPIWRDMFERITGKKLPKSVKESEKIAQEVVGEEGMKRHEEGLKKAEIKRAQVKAESIARRLQNKMYKHKDGIMSARTLIDTKISEGFKEIKQIKQGAVNVYYLRNPKTDEGIKLDGEDEREYAKATIEEQELQSKKSPETVEQHTAPNVEKALEEKKPLLDSPNPIRKYIGINNAGEFIYEDGRGVRFKMAGARNNIRVTEPVAIIPTKGGVVAIPPDYNHDPEFRIVGEKEHDIRKGETEKPEPPTERPIVRGPKQQILGGGAAQSFARFLNNHNLQEEVMKGDPERDGDFYVKFPGHGGIEDLTIEAHDWDKDERKIIATHWYKQGGDLILNSEVVFLCDKKHGQLRLVETSTQNPKTGGEYRTTGENADRGFAKLMITNFTSYFPKGSEILRRGEEVKAEEPKQEAKPATLDRQGLRVLAEKYDLRLPTRMQWDAAYKLVNNAILKSEGKTVVGFIQSAGVAIREFNIGDRIATNSPKTGERVEGIVDGKDEKDNTLRVILQENGMTYTKYVDPRKAVLLEGNKKSEETSDDFVKEHIIVAKPAPFFKEIDILKGELPEKPKTKFQQKADEVDKEIDDLLDEFNNSFDKLAVSILPVSPEQLTLGVKIVAKMTEKGIYKFADVITRAAQKLGFDRIRQLLPALKQAYMSYAATASDDVVDQLTVLKEVRNFNLTENEENVILPSDKGESNATSTVGRPSDTALEGTSSENVRAPETTGDTGTEGAGSRAENERGNAGVNAGEGTPTRRGMGSAEGQVPVSSGGRTGEGRGTSERGLVEGDERKPEDTGGTGRARLNTPQNYTITEDDRLGEGGEVTKFTDNLTAIQIIKQIQKEGRQATPDEQSKLVRYVGWGGLKAVFPRADGSHAKGWEGRHADLQKLLTKEEYEAARRSTQDAHYTAEPVVRAVYDILRRLGFKGGKTLEASAGIGHFFGMMPEDMRGNSELTGIELDNITGEILKQLYPNANILAPLGFQDAALADEYFDATVGNPPFGNQHIPYGLSKHLKNFSIHNFFFARKVDKLRPNGLLVDVITHSFLDKAGEKEREYIARRAKFIGAIRLPNTAFQENARTEVTTDIVILQKLDKKDWGKGDYSWIRTETVPDPLGGEPIPLNKYFVDHPEMMLGRMERSGKMRFKGQVTLAPIEGADIKQQLAEAIQRLPENIYQESSTVKLTDEMKQDATRIMEEAKDYAVGSYFQGKDDNKLYRREIDLATGIPRAMEINDETPWGEKTQWGQGRVERLRGMIHVRDLVRKQIALEANDAPDKEVEANRKQLNKVYDRFVDKHGYITEAGNQSIIGDDNDNPLLLSLEKEFDKGVSKARSQTLKVPVREPSATKADIFKQRVIPTNKPITKADSITDGYYITLSEKGGVDIGHIAKLTGKTEQEIIDELHDKADKPVIFKDPVTGEWVPKEEFLSGNVKAKAKAALDNGNQRYYEALKEVFPKDATPGDINVRMNSPFIQDEDYEKFVRHLIGENANVRVRQLNNGGFWLSLSGGSDTREMAQYGTPDMTASEIITRIMNNRDIVVKEKQRDGSILVLKDETALAKEKADIIKEEFQNWIFQDAERRTRIVNHYNDKINVYAEPKYDGKHLTLPGKVPNAVVELRPHQANSVWRIVRTGKALLDQVVGSGKTFTMIAAAMEMKRLGIAKKPMIIVPNHLVEQWAKAFYELYPGANILAMKKKDFEKQRRRETFARIATGNWDAVIVGHSSFGFIETDPQLRKEFIQKQIAEIQASIDIIREAEGKKSRTVAGLEKQKENLTAKFHELEDMKRDDILKFEELGVDQLFVDESHEFKNLFFSSSRRMLGLGDPSGSKKAFDLFIKTQWLQRKRGGKGVVFATGTPVSNSLTEMYTIQRYLGMDELERLGINSFDTWMNQYGNESVDYELDGTGVKYKAVARLRNLVNMPTLMGMFKQYTDSVNQADLERDYQAKYGKEFPIPKVKGGKRNNVVLAISPEQTAYFATIVHRAENLDPKDKSDNMLRITNDARKAALDMRTIDSNIADHPNSKVNQAAERIFDTWKKWKSKRGTQLVFCDLSVPLASAGSEIKKLAQIIRMADEGDENAIEQVLKMNPDDIIAAQTVKNGFSVYDSLKEKLVSMGVPEKEIAFIHSYNNEAKKDDLFEQVNAGKVRILMGSTSKMGAGTNVQKRLVALHHLDCPWRPSDVEQREGRIIRQGNLFYAEDPNFEVELTAYATERTYDARMWQVQEQKLLGIAGLRNYQGGNEMEDVAAAAATAAEMKAEATGNPLILEDVQLAEKIRKLESLQRGYKSNQYMLEDRVKEYEKDLKLEPTIEKNKAAVKAAEEYIADPFEGNAPTVTINGQKITSFAEATKLANELIQQQKNKQNISKEEEERLKIAEGKARKKHEENEVARFVKETQTSLGTFGFEQYYKAWEKEHGLPFNPDDVVGRVKWELDIDGEKITSISNLQAKLIDLFGGENPIIVNVNGKQLKERIEITNAIQPIIDEYYSKFKNGYQKVGTIGQFEFGFFQDDSGYNAAFWGVLQKDGIQYIGYELHKRGDNPLGLARGLVAIIGRTLRKGINAKLVDNAERYKTAKSEIDGAKAQMGQEFPKTEELEAAKKRHAEVRRILSDESKQHGQQAPALMRVPKGQKPSDIIKARKEKGNQVYGMPVDEAYKLLDTVKKGLQERQGDVSRLKIEPHPESWRDDQEIAIADDLSNAYNGKKVIWFSGFDAQGFYSPETNSVWINVQATNPAQKVFAHELGHYIDLNYPNLYDVPFQKFIEEIEDQPKLMDFYKNKYGEEKFKEAMEHADKYNRKGILGEAFNDLMSERMQDVEFWKKLYAENPDNTRSLIDRIREFIRNLKAKVDYQVARFLRNQERVLDAIDDMMIQFDRRMRQTETIPDFKDSMEAMLWGRRNPGMLPQLEALRKKKEFAISMAKRNYGPTSDQAMQAAFAHQLVNEAITFAKNPEKKTPVEALLLSGAPEKSAQAPIAPPLFQRMSQQATDGYYANLKKETIFNSPEKRSEAAEYAIRRIQDYLRPLKQLQKQKEAETGNKISDALNAYDKETLMYRRVQERFEELHVGLFEPLNKAIAEAKKAGASLDDVRDYIYALHAPERNAFIRAERAKEITYAEEQLQKPNLKPEKKKKLEERLEFLNAGSGMTDADAVKIINDMQKRGLRDVLDDVARNFKAITRFDLDNRHSYGLINDETYKTLLEQYKHYMPLRGFADGDYDESMGRTGRGFDIRGKEWKSAQGRKSRAGDILSYALLQAEEGIVRGEKNQVQRAFYDFVLEYPDLSQYEIEKWYFVRQVDKETGAFITNEDGRDVYKAQSNRPTREEYTSGRVKWALDNETDVIVDFDRKRIENDPNVVGLKVDGKQAYIKIKDVDLAKGLKKLGIERTGIALNAIRKIIQAQRQFITTLSPEFGITNFERDLQEALMNLNAQFDTATVASIVKDLPASINGLIQHRRKNYKGTWAQTAKDYFYSGGGTGFIESKDIEDRTKELVKMFKEAGSNNAWILTKKGAKAVLGAVEAGNDVIENGIRLATYNHLVNKKKWSKQKALVFSKDLTVNFNRKGELGNKMNIAYLFFNAQVQGVARLARNFNSEDPRRRKRAYVQAAVMSLSAFLLGSLFRLVGGQDDDGVYYYDKESDWTRQHKMLIPLPGEKNFFPVSMPYGYNIFWALGDNALRASTGGDIGTSTLTMVTTAMDAFNPMGSNESKTVLGKGAKMLSPTITDPFVDLLLNENFMANRIRPEDYFNQNKPRSEKYFSSVSKEIKAVTDALNTATGGDKTIPGWISVSPEDIEYMIQFYTGGTGKFVMNTIKTVEDLAREGKTEISNVPMGRVVFHKTRSEIYDQQKFYDNVNELEGRIKEINSLAEDKDNVKAINLIRKYQPTIKLKDTKNAVEGGVKKINAEKRAVDQSNLSAAEKRKRIEEQEKKKNILYKGFNQRYQRAIDLVRQR